MISLGCFDCCQMLCLACSEGVVLIINTEQRWKKCVWQMAWIWATWYNLQFKVLHVTRAQECNTHTHTHTQPRYFPHQKWECWLSGSVKPNCLKFSFGGSLVLCTDLCAEAQRCFALNANIRMLTWSQWQCKHAETNIMLTTSSAC